MFWTKPTVFVRYISWGGVEAEQRLQPRTVTWPVVPLQAFSKRTVCDCN
jgi:hypothetical protein